MTFNSDAYDMAWRWFELHARQRMDLFRFYATVYVALLAGLGALWRFEFHIGVLVLSVVGIIFCSIFQGLDRRTSALIKLGEQVMLIEQMRLKDGVGYENIELCRAADHRPQTGISYSRSVTIMNALMFVILLMAAGWTAAHMAGLRLD